MGAAVDRPIDRGPRRAQRLEWLAVPLPWTVRPFKLRAREPETRHADPLAAPCPGLGRPPEGVRVGRRPRGGLVAGPGPAPGRGPTPEAPELVVDPTTAPSEVLAVLPRLGPPLVGRIVTARREAPFHSVDDLDARLRGIGPARLAALRPHLRIETPTAPEPPSGP